ncbi:DNA gyrase subunit A [Candidatus Woesearchaeota archaeon CG10_big_fil_rev_8_21_14_0_10_32_9]|nr:MAG: DNA gyrase subunit A [Candidatus Woesearchaeota archaeon CG10_big_fil_rev_8_21_14_0_10_32_9]
MTEETTPPTERIIHQVIEDEMKSAYLDYSMSVIVGRALPDVRDGLKPVHRRILFAMNDLGMKWNTAYKKCARIVGEVLGKYHPHGDSAVYDSLVRLAQDFSMRYPLIQGQGNFGSVDGDSAAAMRYTEARMSKITDEILQDIDKETIEFTDNFDGTLKEPVVLPCKIPNLLINGSTGIAVGMATNIPPHNIKEISSGVIRLIDDPDITPLELASEIQGPDFPTGGMIQGRAGIRQAYTTGRGKVLVKARMHDEEHNKQKRIIITEIPYMVNKSDLIIQIAENVKEKKIEGISDLRDESDRKGMRIVIELKRDANIDVIKNQLYSYTRLQETFGIIMLGLVKNQPRVLNLKELLVEFLSHRKIVVRKRTEFDLRKAEERAHILEGLLIALQNIDEAIALIKKAESAADAKDKLISRFALSEVQSQAILDMKLQKIAKLETNKIKLEHTDLQTIIANLKRILSDEKEILGIIKQEQKDVIDKFGDERKTQILDQEVEGVDYEDLIPQEDVVVTMSNTGYIKRMPLDTYKTQRRGGVGVIGAESKEDDFIEKVFVANTHSYLLVFTERGIVHWLKVYKIPEVGRYSKGKAIVNLIEIDPTEKISTIIAVNEFTEDHYLLTATKRGIVKKTSLTAYSKPRRGGIIALTLDEGDVMIGAALTDGKQQVLLGTKEGLACKFEETDARPIGRTSRGVTGIRLKGKDEVVGMILVNDDTNVLTLTSNGYGKQTKASEYRLINRGGKGVINVNLTDKNGVVVSIKSVNGDEELMLVTRQGMIVRIKVNQISTIGRNTQGVRVIKLREDDELISTAKILSEEEVEQEVDKEAEELKKHPVSIPVQNFKEEEEDDSEEESSDVEEE